ncbi:hypothetical protein [Bifidobacterium aerophilum]|uniref:hypothetical protein n=1 Tax=Bifidobacterium aerophilum TaxID=1798155 RepID=UPI001EF7DD41|nr:hypothetical protein [Bifidobacterium aerophilum]
MMVALPLTGTSFAAVTLAVAARTVADEVGDLVPVGPIDLTTPLVALIVACLALAVVLVAAIVVLSKPRRTGAKPARRGVHVDGNALERWRDAVADIVRRNHAGSLSREEAFVELADVARRFAGEASGEDMSASTLRDLTVMPRTSGNRHSLDLLKQTIAALYPPEFADAAMNRHAGAVDVDEAAGWVTNLIERWR